MKSLIAATLAAVVFVLIFGTPFASVKPQKDYYYESRVPILPMSFAHADHVAENCILCHHNYNDDTGGGPCMHCHTTNQQVWPLFEKQYHELCRGCHEDKAAEGIDGGPPRKCMDCHLGDDLP